jgi:hypothetical protein
MTKNKPHSKSEMRRLEIMKENVKCELCGSPVKIVGRTTKRYEPIEAKSAPVSPESGEGFEMKKMIDMEWVLDQKLRVRDAESVEMPGERLEELLEMTLKAADLLEDLNQILKTALHNGHHDLIERVKDFCEDYDV